MEAKDLIKQRRKDLGLTLLQVAEACGVSESTALRWENGSIGNMGRSKIKKLAKILQVKPSALIGDDDEIEDLPDRLMRFKKIPMLGSIACGQPIFANQEYEYVSVDKLCKADFCLRAQGDSMIECGIMNNSLVLCKNAETVENGEIAAVIVGDEATLKKVFNYGSVLILKPCNRAFEDLVYKDSELDQIRIIGKAIGCITSF